MIDKIKKMVEIKDADGNFILDASEVALIVKKHRESIYASRKKTCNLDKLAMFEKIKNMVLKEDSGTTLAGGKDGMLDALNGVLKQDTVYKITIKKV